MSTFTPSPEILTSTTPLTNEQRLDLWREKLKQQPTAFRERTGPTGSPPFRPVTGRMVGALSEIRSHGTGDRQP